MRPRIIPRVTSEQQRKSGQRITFLEARTKAKGRIIPRSGMERARTRLEREKQYSKAVSLRAVLQSSGIVQARLVRVEPGKPTAVIEAEKKIAQEIQKRGVGQEEAIEKQKRIEALNRRRREEAAEAEKRKQELEEERASEVGAEVLEEVGIEVKGEERGVVLPELGFQGGEDQGDEGEREKKRKGKRGRRKRGAEGEKIG